MPPASPDALFAADGTEAPDPLPLLPDALAEATPDRPLPVGPVPAPPAPAIDHAAMREAALAAVFADRSPPARATRRPPPARQVATPRPQPYLRSRPRRASGTGVLVAVLVTVAAVTALLATTGGRDETAPTAPAPAGELTVAQNRLLASLPADYGLRNCSPDPRLEAPGRPAGFTCGADGLPPTAPTSANFTLYTDFEGLRGSFSQLIAANAIPPGTSCPAFPGASQYANPPDGSQVACYRTAQAVFIAWTSASDLMLGIVSRYDGDSAALYDWWATRGAFR